MSMLVDLLRDARKRLKLTQQDVADRLGVSRQAVTHWEKGGGIDFANLVRMAEVLQLDVGHVLSQSGGDVPAAALSGLREDRSELGEPRRVLTCEIDESILAEAEANQTDIADVVRRALIDDNRAKRSARWREENREAIREANAELEQNGLWSDGLRLF